MVKKGPPERTQPVRLDFQCDYKSGISRSPLPTLIPVQIVLILRRVNFLIEIESVNEHERTLLVLLRSPNSVRTIVLPLSFVRVDCVLHF